MATATATPESIEAAFRQTLEDVEQFLETIKKHCTSIDEVIEFCKHAQSDPVVMRIILSEMTKPSFKR